MQELGDALRLTKTSRWAGKGDGYRYFRLWYNGERPWANHEFCYSVELWTDEEAQEPGLDISVGFLSYETHAKKLGLTEGQIDHIKKACKALEKSQGLEFRVSKGGATFWVGKDLGSDGLSETGVNNVSGAITSIVHQLTPKIRAILSEEVRA